jgi:V/A-type H+/Na+-transporting ATPase subunit I
MPLGERLRPLRMERVALVAPTETLRDVLVRVADAGTLELDAAATPAEPTDTVREAAVVQDGVVQDGVAALAGWTPADALAGLSDRLGETGGAVTTLPRPRGVDAPTLLRAEGVRRSLTPLVETYGTVPYADVDPTVLVAVTYVLMFGMMFGDVGHGLLLLLAAAALYAGRPRWATRWRRAWPLVAGAGLASALFGLLYGECFGPSGLVPVLWMAPLEHPVPLLEAALALGAVLLAGAYALGTVNRWREGAGRWCCTRRRASPGRRCSAGSAWSPVACTCTGDGWRGPAAWWRRPGWRWRSPASSPRPAAVAPGSRRRRSSCST